MRARSGTGSTSTALVVDDDEDVRVVTARMLAQIGFETRTAPSCEEALSILLDSRAVLSVVMLDVNLPRVRGETPFDRIRGARPGIPVLFVSGDRDHECAAPGTGFLEKPFSIEELRRALGQLVESAAKRSDFSTSS